MVHIDDDLQPGGFRPADNFVHAGEQVRVNRIGRDGVCMHGPSNRQAYCVEPGLFDQIEMRFFNNIAPIAFIWRF